MRRLLPIALVNVACHALALGLAAIAMRPGTPLVPSLARRDFLAGAHLGWSLGWAAWMACALALVGFFFAVARRLDGETAWPRLALLLAGAGAAVDLSCDALYVGLLPSLARGDAALFAAVERGCGLGGQVVANGLYSVAALVSTLGRARAGALVTGLGLGVFGFGMAMVAVGFEGDARHLELVTGPTIGFFCLWSLALARELDAAPRR